MEVSQAGLKNIKMERSKHTASEALRTGTLSAPPGILLSRLKKLRNDMGFNELLGNEDSLGHAFSEACKGLLSLHWLAGQSKLLK